MDKLTKMQNMYSKIVEKIDQLNEQAFQMEQEMTILAAEKRNKNKKIRGKINESNIAERN